MLRYLESGGEGDWLGEGGTNLEVTLSLGKSRLENVFLQGFSWRGGMERETTGILMWSKIYRQDTGGQKHSQYFQSTHLNR